MWGYWACDVSQLLRATVNGTAWTTLGLSSWAHSWGTAPTPKHSGFHLQQGQTPWIPPGSQSRTDPRGCTAGAIRSGSTAVAQWQPLSCASPHPCQTKYWDASNLNQMPNEPQAKAKSSSEAWHREFQLKPLSRESQEPALLLSAAGRSSWMWSQICWDFSASEKNVLLLNSNTSKATPWHLACGQKEIWTRDGKFIVGLLN